MMQKIRSFSISAEVQLPLTHTENAACLNEPKWGKSFAVLFPAPNLQNEKEYLSTVSDEVAALNMEGWTDPTNETEQITLEKASVVVSPKKIIPVGKSASENKTDNVKTNGVGDVPPNKLETCEFCHKVFGRNSLKRHVKGVHEKFRPLNCEICNKGFRYKIELKRHNECTHLGMKRFKCDICNIGFTQKRNLEIHKKSVHLGINDFKCNTCNKGFNKKELLKTHNDFVHLGIKKYKCDICNNDFTTKWSLKIHNDVVHLGMKEFKCEICNNDFITKGSLKKHYDVVHHGIKKYKCEICNKGFSRKFTLKTHNECVHLGIKK